jgi:2-iminobutanoate/2-iminopropanoate deaminase
METQRRTAVKRMLATIAGTIGMGFLAKAEQPASMGIAAEKEANNIVYSDQEVPLFSGHTIFGGLVFIAGKGCHTPGDIAFHTDVVLKELEKELIAAGSSMEKVLKVSVFLNDIADYKGMNAVYQGRFGKNPPVRTTVAVAKGGVPGDSLVEMDCIAYK